MISHQDDSLIEEVPQAAQASRRSDCENCPKAKVEPRQRWVAPQRAVPLTGILSVDKPPEVTSHDVVDAVRRVTGQRKVGHAGTLDPLATGVLLVCLGQATRISEYLMAGRKRYRATIVLGMTTDTYDADGQIVDRGGRTDFTKEEIEDALAGFEGPIEQIPPMYSAIKHSGQPLHRLAREGKTVKRDPRPVEIDEISVLDWTPPTLIVEVACSPGTYIRSVAHDLGQQLGSGAYLAALVRLRSGQFGLEDSVSLACLEEAFEHGCGEEYLIPPDEALLDWPALVVGERDARRICQGQAVQGAPPMPPGNGAMCRAYSLDGEFLAILTYDAVAESWRPKKVFAST
jgi:tRNA pseudouridine55 synthase